VDGEFSHGVSLDKAGRPVLEYASTSGGQAYPEQERIYAPPFTGGFNVVILINRFTLSASPEEFERAFDESAEFMRSQPGFIRHTLVKSLRNPEIYVNIAEWTDAESHIRVVKSPGFAAHIGQLSKVARSEPDLHTVVQDVEVAPAGR
jgi:quinol monooxygenase YgiN